MRRILSRLYGGLGYAAFALSIGHLVGFLAAMGMPKTGLERPSVVRIARSKVRSTALVTRS